MNNRSRRFRFSVAALAALFCLPAALPGQNRLIVTTSPTSPFAIVIDAATGALRGSPFMTSLSGTVAGVTSMALDPTDGTIYAVAKILGMPNRQLATLNRCTFELTVVGNLGDSFSSLTFDSAGQLFGVTGDGASVSETLYTIDKATAAKTLLVHLGNGGDGEVIAYNPNDGLIYHASGNLVPIFEKIDPVTLTITNVPLSGFSTNEVFGMVWDPLANGFLIVDIATQFSLLTASGNRTLLYADGAVIMDSCRDMIIVNDLSGTNDDLDVTFRRNGGPIQAGKGLCRTQPVLPGDTITVGHLSSSGTLALAGPFVAYGSFITTGVIVPSPLAGLHVDLATGVLIFGGSIGGLPLLLPASGFTYSFVAPAGGLAGISFVAQCIVQSGAALNHIYAASDALELQFH